MAKSEEEVREARGYFLRRAVKKTEINKGDRRVNGNRFCSVCGVQLSTIEPTKGKSIAIRNHINCKINDMFSVNICKSSTLCQRNNKLKGENTDEEN